MAGRFICWIFLYLNCVAYSLDTGTKGKCPYLKLGCEDGSCINRKSWCDGVLDCPDKSDESYCNKIESTAYKGLKNINQCGPEYFICDAGNCIPLTAHCDDLPDCEQAEDEEFCDYNSGEVTDGVVTEVTTTSRVTVSTLNSSVPPTPDKTVMIGYPFIPSNIVALQKALRYVMGQRDDHWGWRQDTARVATAIFLTNASYFDSHEGQLTKKQLEVQLALDLMRKGHRPLRLDQLENFIHALLVTCSDPKDFHGVNLVKMMKSEMKRRLTKGVFIHPLAYLVLCNVGHLSDDYIGRIKNMAYRRSEEQRWLDIQAIALLIISCKSKDNSSSSEWKVMKKDVAKNITEWQQQDGSFGSMYGTGLVLQALIAAEEPGTESSKGGAITYLKLHQDWEGSFGNDLDNFYVLPTLNFQSLASLGNRKCKGAYTSTLNTEAGDHDTKQKKSYVHFSLWIGGPKNEIHTISIGSKIHTSFLDIMEISEKMNPKYKHEIWNTDRGPVVNSIAGKSSDVEKGVYWTLYRKVPLPFRPDLSNATVTVARLRLLGARRFIKDIRKLYPKDGEHLAFWLKPYF